MFYYSFKAFKKRKKKILVLSKKRMINDLFKSCFNQDRIYHMIYIEYDIEIKKYFFFSLFND